MSDSSVPARQPMEVEFGHGHLAPEMVGHKRGDGQREQVLAIVWPESCSRDVPEVRVGRAR
eukprot:1415067-Lingulodinium_polyedra.AAC.1